SSKKCSMVCTIMSEISFFGQNLRFLQNNHRKSAKIALFRLTRGVLPSHRIHREDEKTRMNTGEVGLLLTHPAIG
ncbi:MAG TPA: hypothetical protein VM912_09095, partial [Terriglobales bacterium]|nr:hypothetical protein [Terriglobales bacterium]